MPTITSWGEVPRGCLLQNCLHVFPRDTDHAQQANLAVSNDVLRADAKTVFQSWPAEVESCLSGAIINLHCPERCGTIQGRIDHMTHSGYKVKSIAPDKCLWLPSVPKTLASAAAVFYDSQEGRHFFAKEYSCGTIHVVFVRVRPGGFSRGAVSADLITQFPYTPGGRQDTGKLYWKRTK